MLDGFGLYGVIWNLADQVVSDILVASPMDARGRGIALEVRDNGVAADLDGATACLVWTHRGTGKRGTTVFEAVDAAADMAGYSYLNLNYLFYSCFNIAAVVGLSNLRGVRSMRFTFASCSSLEEIDVRGFDPSTLTDRSYCLSSCG